MHSDSAPVDSAAKTAAGKRRPRGPRWERRKDSRPSELLDAALEIFVERGPDGRAEGVAYAAMAAMLIGEVQDLRRRVAAMEAGPSAAPASPRTGSA